jgi:predicted DNA-binding transcriptional regulator AlpA
MRKDLISPRVQIVAPPNRSITCVKEACRELGISRTFFYELRKKRPVPKMARFRFLSSSAKLWEWYESLIEG